MASEAEQHPQHDPVEVDLTVTDADGETTTVTEEITDDEKHRKLVEVTLTVTDDDGNTTTSGEGDPGGARRRCRR